MLSCTKGGLQQGAAPGCGRSRRCADALRDRSAIAERHFVRCRCVTADSRRAARVQPGLDVRSELGICARIGREDETCPAVAARSEIRTCVPSVPHDCRLNAAVLRLTRRGESKDHNAARRDQAAAASAAACGACARLCVAPLKFAFVENSTLVVLLLWRTPHSWFCFCGELHIGGFAFVETSPKFQLGPPRRCA